MKNFQIRINDDLHSALENIAEECETITSKVVRDALDLQVVNEAQAQAGKKLIVEDPKTKERTELIIPGLTRRQK